MTKSVLDPARCPWCGAPLRQPVTGRPRRYCSTRCRQRAARMRRQVVWSLPADDGAPGGASPEAVVAESLRELRSAACALAAAGRYSPPLAGRAERLAGAVLEALEREFPEP